MNDHRCAHFAKSNRGGEADAAGRAGHQGEFAAEIDLRHRKELYPFHADFLSRLAMTFSHGEYAGNPHVKNADDTAYALFQRALSYAPDARAFLGLGMLMQKQRQFSDAAAILKKGLSLFPDNADLALCLGLCFMNRGQFGQALERLEPIEHLDTARRYIRICRQKTAGQHYEPHH